MVLDNLAKRLDGYVATADPPFSQLVPELMELYPDAKVICTTRDPEAWAKSMALIHKLVRPNLLGFLFFWVPGLRHFKKLVGLLTAIFRERYGTDPNTKENALLIWERHHAWLESIVPKEKLFYVSVKDGWPPLCKALGVPIPKDVEFPNLNDAKAIEKGFTDLMVKGLVRWLMVLGVFCLVLALAAGFWRGYGRQ